MAVGNNNNLPVRVYQKQFKEILQRVYQKRAYFGDFSPTGTVEALDGVQDNDAAFYVKTSDIAVTVGTYNTGAAVAFGAGTANTSRFGNRTEIIYTNTAVPYAATWAIHEGIDRFTVNNDLNAAVADRLELQAQAKTKTIDDYVAGFLDTNAGNTAALATMDAAGVLALFNTLSAYYVNLEIVGEAVAKVTPEVYNIIVDHQLTTTGKRSTVDIDNNTVVKFKGFEIQEVPNAKFASGTVALVYPKGIGKPFTGINTMRTVESEDFDGVALQGAGRYGAYIPLDNKAAVTKVTFPVVP